MATKKRQFTVKVGPLQVLVLFDSHALAIRDRDKDESTYGEFVASEGMIYIRDDMAGSFERHVVIHEIGHVIHEICNLHDERLKEQTEENIVSLTTPLWLQVLKDNPEFVEYLCEET